MATIECLRKVDVCALMPGSWLSLALHSLALPSEFEFEFEGTCIYNTYQMT